MDKRELVCHIVSAEWTMFDKVHNCGGRACCQDDWGTFEIMRGSQMEAWPEDLLNRSERGSRRRTESFMREIRLYDGTHLSGRI